MNSDREKQSLLPFLAGWTGFTGHVQLNPVGYDLSWQFGANGPEQPLDPGCPELLHCTALDTHVVVVVMTSPGDTVHVGSFHSGELADHPRLKKELDGAIYSCPADQRQLITDNFDSEALMLLLQEIGYCFPGICGPIAVVLQYRHQVWV